MLAVDDVQFETLCMTDIGLGKSRVARRNNQLDEFAMFQESQGTFRASL
jgi:hypothetical protein